MPEVLDLLLSWIATTAACFYVVMRDERRLAASAQPPSADAAFHEGVIVAVSQLIISAYICYEPLLESRNELGGPRLDVARLLGSFTAGFVLTATAFFVARRDANRTTPDLLERAWPAVSRAAAIVAFGQVAVWVHFWKSRRYGFRGFFLGFFWAVAASLPTLAIAFLLDLIFPDSK